MRNIKELYFKNSIIKFMVSYIGILLLPLFICMMSYESTFNIVEEDIKDKNLAALNHSKNMIDSQIKTIDTLMMQAINNATLVSFTNRINSLDNTFYLDAPKAINVLKQTFGYASMDFVKDVCVYLKNKDYIITRNDMYDGAFYYKNIYKGNISYSEWTKKLIDKEAYDKYIVNEDTITYVHKIPFAINQSTMGAVFCIFEKKELAKFFNSVDIKNGAALYIQDETGEVLLSLGEIGQFPIDSERYNEINPGVYSSKTNGRNTFVLHVDSEMNDWKYTLILPEKVVLDKLIKHRTQITIVFVGATLIGLMICYYMAKKNGRPLEELKSYLKDYLLAFDGSVDTIDDMNHISGTINKIVEQTNYLKEEIDKQLPYLELAFFQKLIKGEFATEQEIHSVAQSAKVEIESKKHLIVTCRVFVNNDMHNMDEKVLEEVNILTILVKDYIKKLMPAKVHFYMVDQLTIVAIIEQEDIKYELIKEQVEKVNEFIVEKYKITPFWGISNECTQLLDMWRAFEQAKRALTTGIVNQACNIVQYEEVVEKKNRYYYPLVFEQRLMMYTKEADNANVKKLFEILYAENFEKRTLDEGTVEKLYAELQSTITKLVDPNEVEQYVNEMRALALKKDDVGAKRYFERIVDVFSEISSSFKQVKRHQQINLVTRIMDYINEVYMDSNLGLGMIATKFNISEGYISSFFKEQTGINFTEYVEQQRINRACELLVGTNLNINEISEQVGYNSVQSFRRAFKRTKGISPSELRKSKNEE